MKLENRCANSRPSLPFQRFKKSRKAPKKFALNSVYIKTHLNRTPIRIQMYPFSHFDRFTIYARTIRFAAVKLYSILCQLPAISNKVLSIEIQLHTQRPAMFRQCRARIAGQMYNNWRVFETAKWKLEIIRAVCGVQATAIGKNIEIAQLCGWWKSTKLRNACTNTCTWPHAIATDYILCTINECIDRELVDAISKFYKIANERIGVSSISG